jgi:hypothetical protein
VDQYEIPFINACIRKFAKRTNQSVEAGFRYLDQYQAIDFLTRHYPSLHLQSVDDAVDELIVWCQRRGGNIELDDSTYYNSHTPQR